MVTSDELNADLYDTVLAERDALAESHAELVGALQEMQVLVEALTGSKSKVAQAALTKARGLVPEAGA